jgi:hypothetical protein
MDDTHREFLTTDEIAVLAGRHIPEHYRLVGVRLDYWVKLDIRIEYYCLLDEEQQGTPDDIKAFQSWSGPLTATIRDYWPRDDVIVTFAQVLPRGD